MTYGRCTVDGVRQVYGLRHVIYKVPVRYRTARLVTVYKVPVRYRTARRVLIYYIRYL